MGGWLSSGVTLGIKMETRACGSPTRSHPVPDLRKTDLMRHVARTLALVTSLVASVACGHKSRSAPASEGPPIASASGSAAEQPGEANSPAAAPTANVQEASRGAATLTFRAVIRDASRNHILEEGEQLSLEIDVYNEGPDSAEGVEVHVGGTSGLIEQFASPLRIGTLPPREHRRVMVAGTVPPLGQVEQGEVLLTIRAAGTAPHLPAPKRFLMAVRPAGEEVEVLSVSVDQPPMPLKGPSQPDAIGVAIGIGAFRDATLATGRFAARDATVMASYFRQASGVPAGRIKVITDGQALRDDLATLFESWLPERATSRSTVYVYFSGRAVVEPETGAVSLVPYDGKPGAQQRLYPLSRLHGALASLPIERAIVFFEVSLEPTGATTVAQASPRWDPDDREVPRGKIIQVIGNTAMQDAHEYQPGQHGLFTYYLLKGLRGEADPKQTGRVLLRDLCRYVETQVQQVAQHEFGNRQAPMCRPAPGGILALEKAPIARTK